MKLLHLCFSKGWGGLEMYPIRLYPFLKKHHINTLYLVNLGSKLEAELKQKKIPYVAINAKNSLISRLFEITKIILENQIELIHCHKSNDLFYAVCTHYFHHAKIAFTEHMGGKRAKKDFYHRWIYRHVDRLFSISHEVKKRNLNALPISPSKVFTLHLGLDINFYKPTLNHSQTSKLKDSLNLPSDKILIGLPGRLTPGKGHDVLIRSASALMKHHKNLTFVFIGGLKGSEGGDENYIQNLQSDIKKYGLTDHFIFTGFQSNIPSVIECLDIACVPSDDEAFGLTVIEVMAMGVPLIASDAGGIPELLRDQQDGLLFPPQDADALGQRISQLIDNPNLAEKFSACALDRIHQLFTQDVHTKQLINHYKKVIDSN